MSDVRKDDADQPVEDVELALDDAASFAGKLHRQNSAAYVFALEGVKERDVAWMQLMEPLLRAVKGYLGDDEKDDDAAVEGVVDAAIDVDAQVQAWLDKEKGS